MPPGGTDPAATPLMAREHRTMPTPRALGRLQRRLHEETRAEVHFDRGMRGLSATDASLYMIDPLGVVVPRTAAAGVRAMTLAAEEGVPVRPRGAAPSLSGQVVGEAIVFDFSKYLN